MAKQGVSALFATDPYVADRGANVPGLSFSFKPPHDFSDANVDAILTAVGARRKTDADRSACPVAAGDFKPRRVRFVRVSGNSFSVVVRSLATLRAASIAIKNVIGNTDPLACAVLVGEFWKDVTAELRNAQNYTPAIGRSTEPATGGIQPYHSGKILYSADATTGTIPITVKVATDTAGSPPTKFAGLWAGCVGAFEPNLPCSTAGRYEYRRYVVTSRVAVDPGDVGAEGAYETSTLPVRSNVAADIFSCGREAANLPSTICVSYNGEDNKRFHLLLN